MKTRIGIIRVDTHSYYYGLFLADYDSLLLQKNNYCCLHYASFIYNAVEPQTFPRVEGFEIVAVFDQDRAKSQAFSETFLNKPKVCSSPEEMIPLVDAAMIMNCNFGGEDHLQLATPFLKAGIPLYVDKPFASTYKDAKAIADLATSTGTPMFNASILSYVPAATFFKNRFQEIGVKYWPIRKHGPDYCKVDLGVVKGLGGAVGQETVGGTGGDSIESRMAYLIHGLSLALNLFGLDVEYVEAYGDLPIEYLHLHMESGTDVMVLNTHSDRFPEECSFFASAYSKFGAVHSGPIGDPEFIAEMASQTP
ncbi:MAG: Gfo/Idh/MocA family oxidoreductase [Lentisphaerota bacterium]